jgi:hypothetical protein
MGVLVDEKYYEVAKAASIAERLLIIARDRIFDDFVERTRPGPTTTIIDVGVSDVISDGANVLERRYAYPRSITACGLGVCNDFQKAYPAVRYVQIRANERLPFDDNAFEVATSNAVLEHVGSQENQRFLIDELVRIAKSVFITVPNRFFPIEHHTAVPVMHYSERGFRLACSVAGKSSWTDEANLILMTRKKLWQLSAHLQRNVSVGYTGLRMGPFSSNLYLAIS